MTAFTLGEINASAATLEDGTAFHLRIRRTETDECLFYDMLLICMLLDETKSAIKWSDYAYNPGEAKPSRFHISGEFVMSGRAECGSEAMQVLSKIQARSNQPRQDSTIPDELSDFASEMEDSWLSPSNPLPPFFRATRLEQLLFWLGSGELDDETARSAALELVSIEPNMADNPCVVEHLAS